MRKVLFVSKPIAPPFHDGAKCLVRDIAMHLGRTRAAVLTTASAPPLLGPVDAEPIYPDAGGFAPALTHNARVFRRLALGPRPDLWHFVFAPNPLSSSVGHALKALYRVPTVQTVASAPRSFEHPERLLFGDRIVVLSAWTHDRFVAAGVDASRIRVIPPAVVVRGPTDDEKAGAGAFLGFAKDAKIVLYPGDIETSNGARLFASAIPEIAKQVTEACFVFACRQKTGGAVKAQAALATELSAWRSRIRFTGEVESLAPLLAVSDVVVFPVGDLYGKVDLPIAVLEAMALGVAVVVLDTGPLSEMRGVVRVRPAARAVADETVALLRSEPRRREIGEQGRAVAVSRHDPNVVAQAYESVYDEIL
jgi:glycosyltransferase involved in cell wall biosynthesis